MRNACFFFSLALFWSGGFVQAHPVVYKGGLVYWGQFRSQQDIQRVGYSFHSRFAVELNRESFQSLGAYQDFKGGLNILLKRWLFPHSQANLYFSNHAGYFEDSLETGFVAQSQLEGDWESRRFYTAFNTTLKYYNEQWNDRYRLRIGLAPYEGTMDELQAWFILQADYFPELVDQLSLTPLLRFFYQNVLWEVGSSLKNDWFLTLMFHY